jgi:hypothetical protein
MLDGRVVYRFAAVFALVLASLAGTSGAGRAQEFVYRGSTADGPTIAQYMKEVGPSATLIAHGSLKIDGVPVNCGTRPTVLNPGFDSWGGAFPGFLILNTKKIKGLSTQVKLYIYSHECGHQFIGASETKADLFAIRRGVRWGWLDAQGMEEICVFISQLKGDAAHPPGPKRCETMRTYYRQLVNGGTQQASSGSRARVQTLGPSN